jgi:phospholipase/lecithinase/hemolysin
MQSHAQLTTSRPVISHIVMMGDSLSDRGTMDHRYLFGIIPMAWVAGLTSKSPQGRFTNGYAWSDHLSAMLVDEFIIHRAEHKHAAGEHKREQLDPTDIADNIITHHQPYQGASRQPLLDAETDIADDVIADRRFEKKLEHSYTLDNDMFVKFHGRDFVRNYDEGGLTSHDYSWQPSTSITRFFSRLILSTLQKKCDTMLSYDHQLEISKAQKQQTLVIEWSGANDLVTVNAEPTRAEADLAIRDRILNAEKLILQGYRHFVLFDMPDLSLCPRFQNLKGAAGDKARQNGKEVVAYFNEQLRKACATLQAKYPGQSSIEVFDVNKIFTAVYNDALNQTHRYPGHFEKSKLHIPFTQSVDFVDKGGLSPASGYMFWDDVHPSADMHEILATEFYQHCEPLFQFTVPQPETPHMLCNSFKKKYDELYRKHMLGAFSIFRDTNFPDIDYRHPLRAIASILKHALEDGGERTRKAITALRWIDDKGKINFEIPALQEARMELAAISRRRNGL